MPICKCVERILQRIATAQGAQLQNALADAYLLLKQDREYRKLSQLRTDESLRAEVTARMPEGWLERESDRLSAVYANLPGECQGLTLASEEADAVVDTLLPFLDRPPAYATYAAAGLGQTGQLALVPRLIVLLRARSMTEVVTARSAIDAIELILGQNDMRVLLASPDANVKTLMGEVVAALRDAEASGIASGRYRSVPERARQALAVLGRAADSIGQPLP